MKYTNPIIPGFHPDPSVCSANGKYYLVCSSFQYFPGVPLFESEDLINWRQIGHVLTRESQLPLRGAGSRGGIYAPTIRYHDGRFYMITTNVSGCGNFFVWTDDIYGEWSEPVFVDREGIDPSLYFEGDKVYFTGNYTTEDGVLAVRQREIDINTGKALSEDRFIWTGTGGKYLEGPHLYKINGAYYLLAAEGGTEYGHMVVYAKSDSPYGPFESYPGNPVLTNRDKGSFQLQGAGHGDLIRDQEGNWWMVHLAFRQMDSWSPYHILGREVCLMPVTFDGEGWFFVGDQGFTPLEVVTDRIREEVVQSKRSRFTFQNTRVGLEWCFLRNPAMENYGLWHGGEEKEKPDQGGNAGALVLRATQVTLDNEEESPSMMLIRQQEMDARLEVMVSVGAGEEDHEASLEAGVTLYMDSRHHHEMAVLRDREGLRLIKRRTTGDMQYVEKELLIGGLPEEAASSSGSGEGAGIRLAVTAAVSEYRMRAYWDGKEYDLGAVAAKYLSSEVAGGFTGVMFGLYAVGEGQAEFKDFSCEFLDDTD